MDRHRKLLVKDFTNRLRDSLLADAGFSLVEELVSLGVVAVGLAMLIAMISTGTKGVTATVNHTLAEGLARSQVEEIKADAYAASYTPLTPPTGYSVTVGVGYWDTGGSGFVGSDTGSGLQKITVTVFRDGTQVLSLEDYKVDR